MYIAHGKIEEVEAKKTHTHPFDWLRQVSAQTKIIFAAVLIFAALYGLVFGLPKDVTYAYTGQDCVRQLTLFPTVMRQTSSSGFGVTFGEGVTVGGFPVASFKTCFVALEPPLSESVLVTSAPWGGVFAAKQYRLLISDAPLAQTTDFIGKTLPITRPVEIRLSAPDVVHDYKFILGEKLANCTQTDSVLSCGIETLDLKQGKEYQAALHRYFGEEKLDELGAGAIKTLRALKLKSASVKSGQTVYSKPKSFSFSYDKDISTVEAELKKKDGNKWEPVSVTTSADGKRAVVTAGGSLDRGADYKLTLTSVEAVDGSALPEPYDVAFTMSGGPKVTGINIGSFGVSQSGSIVISFDQEIDNTDKLSSLVTVGGLSGTISKSGKSLIFSYSGAARCKDFTVTVKKGLESRYGIAQKDDWSFNSRTLCYSVFSIGNSEQGRAILAYSFGSGSKKILYTGAIHGNEIGTRSLMYAWIDELDANARSIPSGVTIVVIPSVNPDGVAAGSRYNANDVDLNRNFDTTDWQEDIETPANQPHPGGGGSAPESEEETQALAAYTSQLRPALTLSYHNVAAYVIANTCGNSGTLANQYAQLSGYSNMTGVSSAFSYEITGTYDDWICQRLGLPSVLIELATRESSEFDRNRAAMWAMARS